METRLANQEIGLQDAAALRRPGPQLLVIGLRPPLDDIHQVQPAGVPFDDRATGRRRDVDVLLRTLKQNLPMAVEVVVLLRHPRHQPPAGALGGAQILPDRPPQVGEVDAPENAVPVGVVGLGLEEVPARPAAPGHAQHLLVHCVGLPVARQKVPPEAARPLDHLRVAGGRQVNGPVRPVSLDVGAWQDRVQPACAGLDGVEELIHPAPVPAGFAGRRPGAELLAVVAHQGQPFALAGQTAEDLHDLLDRLPGNRVAQDLERGQHHYRVALLLGQEGLEQRLGADADRFEVLVVEDRVAVAGLRQRPWEARLPDSLGQPEPSGPAAEISRHGVAQQLQLDELVAVRDDRQDRLEVAAAQHLDLTPLDEAADSLDELRVVFPQVVQQEAAVVEGGLDARVPLQRFEHGQVGLFEIALQHPPEVADRLVVVEREGEMEADYRHRIPIPSRSP